MANNNKKPKDKTDAYTYAINEIFGDLFSNIFDNKESVDKLDNMTKEQLIQEVIKQRRLVAELTARIEHDNTIAKAIKDGFENVVTKQQKAGVTISPSDANIMFEKCSTKLEDKINNTVLDERKKMAVTYRFLQELEKYKAEPHKEMFNKNIDKFININPYELNPEFLEQLMDTMRKDMDNQNVFNYGWDQALSKVLFDAKYKKKAERFVKLPEYREVRVTAEIK